MLTVMTKGIKVKVLEAQVEEIKTLSTRWDAYAAARATRTHKETIEFLTGESK